MSHGTELANEAVQAAIGLWSSTGYQAAADTAYNAYSA